MTQRILEVASHVNCTTMLKPSGAQPRVTSQKFFPPRPETLIDSNCTAFESQEVRVALATGIIPNRPAKTNIRRAVCRQEKAAQFRKLPLNRSLDE